MNEREYFQYPGVLVRIRVRYLKDRGHFLWFVVQLEIYWNDDWTPISRYDTSHGFVHRDDLQPNGEQIKTLPMVFPNYEDALNFAVRDFRVNYEFYTERYKKWTN